ncbi:hypothetical protein [Methanoculleus chikugoensis]|uniref:hypothetical protein n=1 Tax=Methanoculleus chikugoensis TaxID=118126 RepID=UPI0006D09D82|nr:hypothetical protein [Methanoculleus chikugoensis]
MLAGAAELVSRVRGQQGNGIRGAVSIDWPELVAFERTFTDPIPRRKEEGFRGGRGSIPITGVARFAGPDRVAVGGDMLIARYIVVAAGAHARALGVPGEDLMTSSDDFFSLPALPPERIVFIGGGLHLV